MGREQGASAASSGLSFGHRPHIFLTKRPRARAIAPQELPRLLTRGLGVAPRPPKIARPRTRVPWGQGQGVAAALGAARPFGFPFLPSSD